MENFLQNECVSYEQAKKLKALGFNDPFSIGYYQNGIIKPNDAQHTNESIEDLDEDDIVIAPTFHQAFRWIRNTYRLHHISDMNRFYIDRSFTYEESESKSLDSLLDKINEKEIKKVLV
jgi:hypothetical protein